MTNKKVLLISYYWPPAGGPGVQRWLKFVSYLPKYGVEPIVYTPKNAEYPILDKDLLHQIPKEITHIQQPIREPATWAKKLFSKKTKQLQSGIMPSKKAGIVTRFLLYIRANFFIPDARVTWVKSSVSFLKKYCKENNIQTIITTGPPHSMHLIGMQLQKEIGVKWLADFRDPWTSIHYFEQLPLTSYARKRHRELERKVLTTADSISVTSEPTKKEFQKLTSKPIYVVTNGYDEKLLLKERPKVDSKFSIAHIGSLLSDRNPEQLWKAISDLLKKYSSLKKDLEIRLAGVVSDEVLQSIRKHGLQDFVKEYGYLSHSEAIRLQHKSQLLLLLEMDKEETKVILPGKLFEYMAARRPILALGPKEGAVEPILEKTKSGTYFTYLEYDAIYIYLEKKYQVYTQYQTILINSTGIEIYSREYLSEKMAKILKNLSDENISLNKDYCNQ